jgi:hypothetical protein
MLISLTPPIAVSQANRARKGTFALALSRLLMKRFDGNGNGWMSTKISRSNNFMNSDSTMPHSLPLILTPYGET